MRILIVSQHFWPENFRITDYAAALVEAGHEVDVLTGMPNYPQGQFFKGYGPFKPKEEKHRGMTIRRVPLIPRGKSKGFRLALNYLSYVVMASLMAPFRTKGRYDAIFVYATSPITQAIPAMVIKWFTKTPIILNVQDLWPQSVSAVGAIKHKHILNLIGLLVKFIYKHCDRIMVQSKGFMPAIEAMGVPSDKIFYLPNCAEDLYQVISKQDTPDIAALMPKGFVVMFAGNLGKAQDLPTLVQAAERLKDHQDIHFVILGDGSEKANLEGSIRERQLKNIHCLGRHPVEQMPAFFSHADALLVMLKDEPIFALTIPGKIQSYLACAKPVIAAMRGSGADVITESRSGLSVPPEDPQALAQAILSLYQSSEQERESMGHRGHAYYQNYFSRSAFTQLLEKELLCLPSRS